jgi:hypothetical protein
VRRAQGAQAVDGSIRTLLLRPPRRSCQVSDRIEQGSWVLVRDRQPRASRAGWSPSLQLKTSLPSSPALRFTHLPTLGLNLDPRRSTILTDWYDRRSL